MWGVWAEGLFVAAGGCRGCQGLELDTQLRHTQCRVWESDSSEDAGGFVDSRQTHSTDTHSAGSLLFPQGDGRCVLGRKSVQPPLMWAEICSSLGEPR